jgi:hypothetical protein
LAALAWLVACHPAPSSPLDSSFRRVGSVDVAPIEPFARLPTSLGVLPDGRLLLPETDGAWIHVTGKDGQGITRLGGPSPTPLDSTSTPGLFRAISAIARLPDGRLLASDASSNLITVFTPELRPERTFRVPGARRIYGIETLPDGRVAAAVAPRNPATGGQVLLFAPGDSGPGFLPPDPLFEHNRWQGVAATAITATRDGRVLAFWPALPWAMAISGVGDSLGRLGSMSELYKGPSSGPGPRGGSEAVQRWLESFTPLVAVQPVGDWLVFEYRAARPAEPRNRAKPARVPSEPAHPEPPAEPGQMFLNVYDARGRPVARDLVLPPGTRVLRSDDPHRLYLVTRSDPHELRIEIWEPRTGA